MKISTKRAEHTAILTVVVTLVFFIAVWILSISSGSVALGALKWQFLTAMFISVILWFQFRLKSLAEQEQLELAGVDGDQEQTIFAQQGSEISMFKVASKRLAAFEKWFLPIASLLLAVYQITVGVIVFNSSRKFASAVPDSPQIYAVFIFLVAFVTFLISRYATGMSAQDKWKPLRSLGSWLFCCAVMAFLIAIGLAVAGMKSYYLHIIMSWVTPAIMFVTGIETALNVIFDIYRPRFQDQYHRAGFDSRILGLFSEPGGVFHSIASAVDYQFGFQVSQTWFYKLFEKAVLPLIMLSVLVLWLMSSFLIVRPGQQAVIERFGVIQNKLAPVGPGLKLKLPWPIDIAYIEDVDKIQFIPIAYVPKDDPSDRTPLLWGKAHYKEEENLLVGSKTVGTSSEKGASSFGMVVTAVPLYYRVKNVKDYLYKNADPKQTLSALAHRELTRFAVSAKVETSDDPNISSDSIFGAGRARAARILEDRIQRAADENKLGVEIVFVAIEGVHPPKEVAQSYQDVVGAIQKRQALVLAAMAKRNKTLASIGGSVEQVFDMYNLSEEYLKASTRNDTPEIRRISSQLDSKINQASGEIYRKLSKAKSYSFDRVVRSKADGQRFSSQVKAYRAAPKIYINELRLSMLEDTLDGIRKYVVISDANDEQILIFDLKDKLQQSLYDIDISEDDK